ncbi:hypothetical protein TL16_g05678 [Triparma laevis f. inornata]|uniref:Uncharacterized protein n=1 Tax=Triparma laevis f. inornata TaxID=1714386 RepID=A0A9W7ALZ8_9STRA|nr:hypothetical protein TL16_g05678 [Triparma laevis f. inornata]
MVQISPAPNTDAKTPKSNPKDPHAGDLEKGLKKPKIIPQPSRSERSYRDDISSRDDAELQTLARDLLGKEPGQVSDNWAKVRMKTCAQTHDKTLGRILKEYEWLGPMIDHLLYNKLRVVQSTCEKSLAELTVEDGVILGRMFAGHLSTSVMGEYAIDAWICACPCLDEFFAKEPSMLVMFEKVADLLLERVSWGLKLRCFTGAILSTADISTDIFMLATYFYTDGQAKFAYATLAMLSVSIFFQLCAVVLIQPKTTKLKDYMVEISSVMFFVKPAVDAYRVASGNKTKEGVMASPFLEMTLIKIIELFSECIPASIVQIYVVFFNEGGSIAAYTSIFASLMTSGFICATISYDFDTSPTRRKQVADFYGIIPDHPIRRALCFILLIALSASFLLLKGVGLTICIDAADSHTVLYLFAELAVYLIYKVARNDYWYWTPGKGFTRFYISTCFRVFIKLVTDFTCIIQFRHPNEVGSVYFCLSTLYNAIVFPILAVYYWDKTKGPSSIPAHENIEDYTFAYQPSSMYSNILILQVFWFSLAIGFFMTIRRSHIQSFCRDNTTSSNLKKQFSRTNEDFIKSNVLTYHQDFHKGFVDEVEAWVLEGWVEWHEHKPKWFTKAMKKAVPKGMREKADKLLMDRKDELDKTEYA